MGYRGSGAELSLWRGQLFQFRAEVHVAAAADFQLSLPILEAGLFERDRVLAFLHLHVRRSVADKVAVKFDVGAVRNGDDVPHLGIAPNGQTGI